MSKDLTSPDLTSPHPASISTATARQQLRRSMRQLRQQLSHDQQAAASLGAKLTLERLPQFQESQNIAAYLASDGELDLSPCIKLIHKSGKQCFLPRITSKTTMEFHAFCAGDDLVNNRYGIGEPKESAPLISAAQLELVLLPLVGFSRDGARLGMGGGFYDRYFAFKAQQNSNTNDDTQKPFLIGIAHSLQEVDQLPTESWDIPLCGILTEKEYIPV